MNPYYDLESTHCNVFYRRFASFLAQCNKVDDAVKAQIDAMMNLNKHLKPATVTDSFPEQKGCGKFTDLYSKLETYYDKWADLNHPRY